MPWLVRFHCSQLCSPNSQRPLDPMTSSKQTASIRFSSFQSYRAQSYTPHRTPQTLHRYLAYNGEEQLDKNTSLPWPQLSWIISTELLSLLETVYAKGFGRVLERSGICKRFRLWGDCDAMEEAVYKAINQWNVPIPGIIKKYV